LLQYSVPKLTLQPLVENSLYHGIEAKLGQGTIKIEAAEDNDKLIISVADDGIGIEGAKLKELRDLIYDDSVPTAKGKYNLSIALKNIHKRLTLLYGKEYGLKIESEKNIGTTIEIHIPACVK
jgi:two-component system sensor histidine kinase YesM